MMEEHPTPTLLSGCASMRVYIRRAADGWIFLRSYQGFTYVCTDSNECITILQSPRWWIFRVGIPHTTWCICCSQYAHNFIMQMGIPVCEYFSNPSPYAYRDPCMHTAISVCIILHMGIQDLIPHMGTISLCVRGSPYANIPAICKLTRVDTTNHLENY